MDTTQDEVSMRDAIEKEITERLTKEYAQKYKEFQDKLETDAKELVKQTVEDWKKEQQGTKLTDEELQKLLTQEYIEFTLKLTVRDTEGNPKEKSFTLRELPQTLEKKFVKNTTTKLKPHLKAIASLTEKVIEGTITTKMETIMDAIEPSFDILADTVVMILNPFNNDADITSSWVQDNISTRRQWNIVEAQERLNGLRNFFSPDSLFSPGKR